MSERLKNAHTQLETFENSSSHKLYSTTMSHNRNFLPGYVGNASLASTRILVITMIVFSLLLFLFYSFFIIGSLLTDPPKTIKTIRQLTNSPFKFKVDTVPYIPDAFKRSTEPDVVKLYSKVMKGPDPVLVPLKTGVDLMKTGKPFREFLTLFGVRK